jgi:hypothetical protein
MFVPILLFAAFLAPLAAPAQTNSQRSMLLVLGAPGEPEYAEQFTNAAGGWKQAALAGGLQLSVIGEDSANATNDRARLLEWLSAEGDRAGGELWLVFIGHGTFDGRAAKFNLRGPDIAADELAAALKTCRRPLAIVNCASASSPFIAALSGPDRVIVTATRSGYEVNATRFGTRLARAMAGTDADLDKDGQTSLLEGFLMASRQVDQFYREEGRLATEHALLDDNGDALGTPAGWFRGVRAVKAAAGGRSVDGARAHQWSLVRSEAERGWSPDRQARRAVLEQKLSDLRGRKKEVAEADYYRELEAILLEIARLYDPPPR